LTGGSNRAFDILTLYTIQNHLKELSSISTILRIVGCLSFFLEMGMLKFRGLKIIVV